MVHSVYDALTLAHLILLVFSVRNFVQSPSLLTFIVPATVLGLAYDNAVIAIGSTLGEGRPLIALSVWRFYLHATITPLLILYAGLLARRLGVQWAKTQVSILSFLVLTAAMIAVGVWEDVIHLELVPSTTTDGLRYTNSFTSGPPIPAIVVIVVMIVVGGFIWRQRGWWVLCIGSVLMFLFAGAGASSLVLSNVGEVIFALSLVLTDYKTRELGTNNDECRLHVD